MAAALSQVLQVGAVASFEGQTSPAGALPAPALSAMEPAAELERCYEQEPAFGSRDGFAATALEEPVYADQFEWGRLEVTLEYADPEGETMQIAVLRLPARGECDERIGSLILNPGGPGGSGVFVVALAAVGLKDTPIVRRLDVVGFDPRGVGASTPAISCFTDEEHDRRKNLTTWRKLGPAADRVRWLAVRLVVVGRPATEGAPRAAPPQAEVITRIPC